MTSRGAWMRRACDWGPILDARNHDPKPPPPCSPLSRRVALRGTVGERLLHRGARAEDSAHVHGFDHLARELRRHVVREREEADHAQCHAMAVLAMALERALVDAHRADHLRLPRGLLSQRVRVLTDLVADGDADELGAV